MNTLPQSVCNNSVPFCPLHKRFPPAASKSVIRYFRLHRKVYYPHPHIHGRRTLISTDESKSGRGSIHLTNLPDGGGKTGVPNPVSIFRKLSPPTDKHQNPSQTPRQLAPKRLINPSRPLDKAPKKNPRRGGENRVPPRATLMNHKHDPRRAVSRPAAERWKPLPRITPAV